MQHRIKPAIAVALLSLCITTAASSQGIALSPRFDSLFTALFHRDQFSGAVLIATHSRIIYEKAFGFANREDNLPFATNTREYIGSVSKQLTALGIMVLHDHAKLRYDQSIKDFFPELPDCMQPVTIRNLLYHTSGLSIFDDYPNITEQDVFKVVLSQKELRFKPGEKFEYCNTGYSLLGMIIEKISGESLNTFLKKSIFTPLGMHNTLVNEITHPDTDRAIGYTQYGTINNYDNYMGGNASILSTVDDLYKWDEAFGKSRIVSASSWKEALTSSAETTGNHALVLKDEMFGPKTYTFGWWLAYPDNTPHYWHDGFFGGYVSYNECIPSTGTAIIVISNLRSHGIYEIRQAILNILAARPYRLPPIAASVFLYKNIPSLGVDSAVSKVRQFHAAANPDYDCSESDLNSYGYVVLRAGRITEAIKIFQLNTLLYPNSFNVYDSLADAYEKAGDKSAALESCKKALAIEPTNNYMKNRIAGLEK